MLPFPKCPVCGGEVIEKTVEEILRGGNNTAIVRVKTEVCLRCGERLFAPDTIAQFERIVEKLEQRETRDFEPIGRNRSLPLYQRPLLHQGSERLPLVYRGFRFY